jgi:hypothetical protein
MPCAPQGVKGSDDDVKNKEYYRIRQSGIGRLEDPECQDPTVR